MREILLFFKIVIFDHWIFFLNSESVICKIGKRTKKKKNIWEFASSPLVARNCGKCIWGDNISPVCRVDSEHV